MFHVQVEAHLDTLVNEQAAMVLNRVGLAEAYRTVQAYQPKQVKPSSIAVIDWLIDSFVFIVISTVYQPFDGSHHWSFHAIENMSA